MREFTAPAHAFCPPLPGYAELESERLARQIRLLEINAKERAERAKETRMFTFVALAVVSALFIFAASVGFQRAEREYQEGRV